MSRWTRLPSYIMVGLGLISATVFLPSLSGCTQQDGSVGALLEQFNGTSNLPDDTVAQLKNLRTVYDRYSLDDEAREAQFDQLVDAFKIIRRSYVNPVSDQDLLSFAIAGLEDDPQSWLGAQKTRATGEKVTDVALDEMLAQLDPHSSYMTAQEFQELMVDTSGEFGGLGIEVQAGDGYLKIVSPIEDTPAYHAGIQPEDRITHVDGQSLMDWSFIQTVRKLRGKPGSPVRVTIEREGSAPFDLTIERAIIQVKAVRFALYEDYLHLRVVSFSERTLEDVENAIEAAQSQLGRNPRGVVLDLRNNPGGLLQQSVALSDLFLDEGKVVSIRGRDENDVRTYAASDGQMLAGVPVVVLVNEGSASASEIVAGALQDSERAIVMGRNSFGKGSVQTIIPLRRDGAVRLTTALYYLPSGRTIQKVGIAPDITLKAVVNAQEQAGTEPDSAQMRREADLPHVLEAENVLQGGAQTLAGHLGHVNAAACPEIGPKQDQELGCALSFLQAGSAARFISKVN